MRELTCRMREVAENWVQLDPFRPYSGLAYTDLDLLIDEIDREMPGAYIEMTRSLEPARELVSSALNAWNRREFSTAGRAVHSILIWDPDRRRLLRADQALQEAPEWLHRLRTGPPPGLGLQNFVTDLEFEGRALRTQVGPAGWLDSLLDALKALRNGTWPGDLISSQPGLLADLPWLQSYERTETIRKALQPHLPPTPLPTLSGRRETRFGPDGDLSFLSLSTPGCRKRVVLQPGSTSVTTAPPVEMYAKARSRSCASTNLITRCRYSVKKSSSWKPC